MYLTSLDADGDQGVWLDMAMMCESCNEREATVHVRVLPAEGAGKQIMHLCRTCAAKKGLLSGEAPESAMPLRCRCSGLS